MAWTLVSAWALAGPHDEGDAYCIDTISWSDLRVFETVMLCMKSLEFVRIKLGIILSGLVGSLTIFSRNSSSLRCKGKLVNTVYPKVICWQQMDNTSIPTDEREVEIPGNENLWHGLNAVYEIFNKFQIGIQRIYWMVQQREVNTC